MKHKIALLTIPLEKSLVDAFTLVTKVWYDNKQRVEELVSLPRTSIYVGGGGGERGKK